MVLFDVFFENLPFYLNVLFSENLLSFEHFFAALLISQRILRVDWDLRTILFV